MQNFLTYKHFVSSSLKCCSLFSKAGDRMHSECWRCFPEPFPNIPDQYHLRLLEHASKYRFITWLLTCIPVYYSFLNGKLRISILLTENKSPHFKRKAIGKKKTNNAELITGEIAAEANLILVLMGLHLLFISFFSKRDHMAIKSTHTKPLYFPCFWTSSSHGREDTGLLSRQNKEKSMATEAPPSWAL